MKNLRYYREGFYTFEDIYHGRNRLNVCGHSGYYENGFMLCLDENGHYIGKTAQGLYEILTPHYARAFHYIRLLLCNSADGDNNSFAYKFSLLCPTSYIESYLGNVRTRRITYDIMQEKFSFNVNPANPRVMNSIFQVGFVSRINSPGFPESMRTDFYQNLATSLHNIESYEPLDPNTPHHPVWFYNGTRITDERQVY
ncbi:hypothetical protein ABLB69_14895 [Xenorhabdus khoisanae]|uniref:Uncharacterized protein n=1 Tax=Xenorhabdus khoisanae TaxID=880157 RepID=A0A0J5FPR0_9GAMM|nr:hypothetical protein [Xenorhabdus khoisanae]KMJ44291.1 hypothetical protein AB204_15160 [Xenorhabdus khoisanae]